MSSVSRFCYSRGQVCNDYMCFTSRTCLMIDLGYIQSKKLTKPTKYKVKGYPRQVRQLLLIGHLPICRCCYSKRLLTCDHIIPKAKGGKNDTTNKQILCKDCNLLKGKRIISLIDLRVEALNKRKKNG